MAADRDVIGVDDARIAGAQAGQVSVESFTYDPVADKWPPVVLTDGRMPATRNEIALAFGPVALLAANALAAWPQRHAARLPTGQVLRTE